jgi:hypothetical protein
MDSETGKENYEEQVVSMRVQNSRAVPVMFHLEPWGEQYVMPSEATFSVVARGPREDTLELEYTDDAIVLYGWSGSTVSLFYKGEEIKAGNWERGLIPATPSYQQQP